MEYENKVKELSDQIATLNTEIDYFKNDHLQAAQQDFASELKLQQDKSRLDREQLALALEQAKFQQQSLASESQHYKEELTQKNTELAEFAKTSQATQEEFEATHLELTRTKRKYKDVKEQVSMLTEQLR